MFTSLQPLTFRHILKRFSISLFIFSLLALLGVPEEAMAQQRRKNPKTQLKKQVAAVPAVPTGIDPPFLKPDGNWVDSVFKTLTPDERIAQLIMVAAYSNRDRLFEDTISTLIKEHKIGGLVFFQGGPVRQSKLLNRYQAESKVPLLVAMDAEWGVGMRLDSTIKFPYQMSLGATDDEQLVYDMGAEIARQFKRLGMHVNFAPVVDVNNNPNNPVINFRSFGEDKHNVTRKAIAYMRGLQDNHILANAKHFPGHGDTDVDSHYALPLISHQRQRLDDIELYPFREMIREGLGSMMVAHLNIPALDTTKNLPSTLSKAIVTDLLRNELGFKGLIFTDAMNMKGVINSFPAGEADMRAILAGNDVLEFTKDVPLAISLIRDAIDKGMITQEEIDQRCRKVLALKQWVGLNNYRPVDLDHLIEDLNNPTARFISRSLTENALTLLRNRQDILPLQRLDTLRIATLAIGTTTETNFQKMVGNYTVADHFYLPPNSRIEDLYAMKNKLQPYDLVLTSFHQMGLRPANNFGITPEMVVLVRDLVESEKAIVTVFGNAYSLNTIKGVEKAPAVIMAYQESENTQELAAQLIFGGIGAEGKLPVTVSGAFPGKAGLHSPEGPRFEYTLPEEVGLDSHILARIDTIAQEMIDQKAAPGAQVLVAKDGKVIFHKSYGYHTYDQEIPVKNEDVYDLASVTKISTALLALMRLQDEGKFDVDKTIGDYLPEFRKSNKANLTFRELLTHQARLQAWIPFWKSAVRKNGSFKWATFKNKPSRRFPVKVADNLYLHRNYLKKMYREIKDSPLNEKPGYVYSDLSFYLYPLIVQRLTGKDFETYLKETVYQPIGANSLTFNPGQHFPLSRIVPTEYDSLFRKQLLHGYVHDEGASMLGGVSGHAGLFGNANDLAKLMQLYLQKGSFEGKQYISEETMNEFTSCQFCPDNRRALGFDRPIEPAKPNSNAAFSASPQSFGHSGFTGTYVWMDPAHDLVYVFLSNRVYPTRNNSKLSDLNIRTRIHQVVYDALQAAEKQSRQPKFR
jgi:beta-N-acetylhexosaminidase